MATSNEKTELSFKERRPEIVFLLVFCLLLGGGFTLLSVNWVNNHLVEPFTAGVAKASGITLDLLGQDVTMEHTIIRNSRFAVNIKNGCNGVETMIIFLAAVLAFPATWKSRGIGLLMGTLIIQVINLVRVVALFFTGAYYPALFDTSHTVIWQSVVVTAGVILFLIWARRFAELNETPASS